MEKDVQKLLFGLDAARKSIGRVSGVKGSVFEYEYAQIYDKLAMLGIDNRRRLRRKYRP